ncbi:Ubiquitin-like protein ATG12 [Penicillium argentinense]|uniref:Ubiquitin-like protein ATG12 n=1 Tax=Penicillium argentinense TaxID=1131581 RepID=A0A9W9EYB5_9EURO|nr:Ubiquitin-like protein ATG12 [Penicillium argentinense]KAJ5090144.1 Ubiquitin-like protein ATG12 [Penicillium argentinense]
MNPYPSSAGEERSARDSPTSPPSSTNLSHRPSPVHPGQSEPGSPRRETPIPDDAHGADLPMNMTASVILTGLPTDAHQALADVEAIDTGKGKENIPPFDPQDSLDSHELVTIRFIPLPSAPILKNKVFKISASQKFETVVKFLRKKLDCKDTDSVFCYVNHVFAPGLDEGVGGLFRCFKTDDQLIVAYSMTPAFG